MVVVHPEYALLIMEVNELIEEIANLIVEKDTLNYYVCKDIQIDYTLKLGALEHKLLVAENNYEKKLRKLEIIEQKLVRKLPINMEAIDRKIDAEFKTQSKLEKDMSQDVDFAIEMTSMELIDYDIIDEMNVDYFKLQKLYNPIFDIEPSEEKVKMYTKIQRDYKKCNYKKLHKLAKDYDEDYVFQDEINNLKNMKEKFIEIFKANKREIRKIKNSFPYNQKTILEDENLCRRKKDSLNRQITEINLENKKLDKKINDKLKKIY